MKEYRSFRFIVGGLLLLTGLVLCFQFFGSAGRDHNISNVLLCVIAGTCLISPGRKMLRNLTGAGLLVMFFVLIPSSISTPSPLNPTAGMAGFGPALLALALLILSAVMFSGTLSNWAARPFTAIIDNVYFGNNSRDVPPLTLRLARAYRRDLRFEEALDECERQLEYHPRSIDLWFEMIHTTREAGDEKAMETYLRRARRRFTAEECRQLEFEFQRYLSVSEEQSVVRAGPMALPLPAPRPGGFLSPPSAPERVASREPTKKLRPWNRE